MSAPRLLDLFSGAGGCAAGYKAAGFRVVGVDNRPQPRYAGDEFVQWDALALLRRLLRGHSVGPLSDGTYLGLGDFAGFHASPPCQFASDLRHRTGKRYPDLVTPTRRLLRALGLPYVIENVSADVLEDPVMLCGSMFGLGANGRQLRRHRYFECNFPVLRSSCQHRGQPVGVYGTGGGGQMTRGYKAAGVAEAREALGTPWMTLAECAQAVPPEMTEHIGFYLMQELKSPEPTVGAQARGSRMATTTVRGLPNGAG